MARTAPSIFSLPEKVVSTGVFLRCSPAIWRKRCNWVFSLAGSDSYQLPAKVARRFSVQDRVALLKKFDIVFARIEAARALGKTTLYYLSLRSIAPPVKAVVISNLQGRRWQSLVSGAGADPCESKCWTCCHHADRLSRQMSE